MRQAKAAEKWFSEGEWFGGLDSNRDLDDANLQAAFSKPKKSKIEEKSKSENIEDKMELDDPVSKLIKEKTETESESESDSDLETDEEEAQAERLREMEERIGKICLTLVFIIN